MSIFSQKQKHIGIHIWKHIIHILGYGATLQFTRGNIFIFNHEPSNMYCVIKTSVCVEQELLATNSTPLQSNQFVYGFDTDTISADQEK